MGILYRHLGTPYLSHIQGLSIHVILDSFLDFLTIEDRTDNLSRNFGTELLIYAA